MSLMIGPCVEGVLVFIKENYSSQALVEIEDMCCLTTCFCVFSLLGYWLTNSFFLISTAEAS